MAPSQCHVPSLRSVREREREKRRMNQRCVIYYEVKWKQGNFGDQYGAWSAGPAGWRENTKHKPPPLCFPLFLSLLSIFSLTFSLPLFFKHLDLFLVLQLVFKEKREKGKKTSNMKVTLLALGYMPCHFSPTPQKQQGDPVNSLAEQIMWKC